MRHLVPVLLLCAPAEATTLLDWGVPELTRHAELVLVGTVAAQGTRVERGLRGTRLLTDTTFAVEEVWKGRRPVALTITQPGGAVGERRQHVHGQARFAVGERVVLFVERADTGQLVVCGLSLGKYTVTEVPAGLIARRTPFGLTRLDRPLRFAGVPDEDAMPLGVLRARVRGLVDVRPAPSVVVPRTVR